MTDAAQTFVVYGLVGLTGCALIWLFSPAMRGFDLQDVPSDHELAGASAALD